MAQTDKTGWKLEKDARIENVNSDHTHEHHVERNIDFFYFSCITNESKFFLQDLKKI